MGHYYHSLSVDATIMVHKNCSIKSEHVVSIIFVTQWVTIAQYYLLRPSEVHVSRGPVDMMYMWAIATFLREKFLCAYSLCSKCKISVKGGSGISRVQDQFCLWKSEIKIHEDLGDGVICDRLF